MKKRDFHQIGPLANAFITLFFGMFSLLCVIPFVTVIMASFTEEKTLAINGYSLFPKKMSLSAYEYMFKAGDQILRSFSVSVFVTVIGTIISVVVTAFFAYALSRPNFKYRTFFNYYGGFTMLFGGGLVPTYLVVTRIVGIRDSIWALILPMTLNMFFVIVMRTFFITSVPSAIIEAAQIDGASELKTFLKIVIPISLPSIATIGLFTTLGYWNDWFNALLYLDSARIMPIQYLLMQIEKQMQFLIQNSNAMGASSTEIRNLPSESLRMAIVVVSTLPIACVYPFFQKYFISGLTVGSVKG